MHQAQSWSDALVAERAQLSGSQGTGCFQMRTQNLDEHELGELGRRETSPREFRRPLANKLVEQPLQDRRLLSCCAFSRSSILRFVR